MASREIKHHSSGFALLITIIVVTVLISIGLAVVELTLKQVRLSTNAKESESAFHAANAGLECGRYIRRIASTTMEVGGDINPACFSAALFSNTKSSVQANANGNVYLYNYSFTWTAGANSDKPRCSTILTLVMVADPLGSGLSLNVVPYIPGYPTTVPKTCNAGERCTVLSAHGFNRDCNTAGGYGSVEREVLLEF
jgi:hypothetical protein